MEDNKPQEKVTLDIGKRDKAADKRRDHWCGLSEEAKKLAHQQMKNWKSREEWRS